MESPFKHEPVMVEEVRNALRLRPGAVLVDGTLGLGGHAMAYLPLISPGGVFLGFDWDESMLREAKARIGAVDGVQLYFFGRDFRAIPEELDGLDFRADGILLDQGLNSAQIEDPERGIAFKTDGPLDMRMDRSRGEPAAALLNRFAPGEIEWMLREYGDERFARGIAKRIVDRRRESPLRTTNDLVDCVLAAIPPAAREKRIHPATRTFQAVRIAVNGELDGLEEAMLEIAARLAPGGVLVTLSYHSGEDRAVKRAFRAASADFEELTRRPLTPSEDESRRNPRARSAKLRALRRLP